MLRPLDRIYIKTFCQVWPAENPRKQSVVTVLFTDSVSKKNPNIEAVSPPSPNEYHSAWRPGRESTHVAGHGGSLYSVSDKLFGWHCSVTTPSNTQYLYPKVENPPEHLCSSSSNSGGCLVQISQHESSSVAES